MIIRHIFLKFIDISFPNLTNFMNIFYTKHIINKFYQTNINLIFDNNNNINIQA